MNFFLNDSVQKFLRAFLKLALLTLFSLAACGTRIGNPIGKDDPVRASSGPVDPLRPTTETIATLPNPLPPKCNAKATMQSLNSTQTVGQVEVVISPAPSAPASVSHTSPSRVTEDSSVFATAERGVYVVSVVPQGFAACYFTVIIDDISFNKNIVVTVTP